MPITHPLIALTELLAVNGFAVQLVGTDCAPPSPAAGVAYLVTTTAPLPIPGELR